MSINKLITFNVAIAYALFSLGLAGVNIGLPEFLSMRNIGLFIILISVFSVKVYKKNVEFRVESYITLLLVMLSLILIWIFLSVLFSPYQDAVSLQDILAWVSIPIIIFLTYQLTKYIRVKQFIKILVIVQFLVIPFLSIWLYRNLGTNILDFTLTRAFIHNNITVGLNRLLNGIVYLNVASTTIAMGIVKSKRYIYILSIVNIILLTGLSFVTGSRQSIVAVIFTFILCYLLNRHVRNIKTINYKNIAFVLIFIFAVTSILRIDSIKFWVEERFIDKTTEQLTTGDRRTQIYQQALLDIKEYPLFGTGPGTYHNVSLLGEHTHNGYLYVMNNYGIIPFVLISVLFTVLLFTSLRNSKTLIDSESIDMFLIMMSSVMLFIFIMNVFKDLTTTLSFWMSFVLLIEFQQRKVTTGELNNNN